MKATKCTWWDIEVFECIFTFDLWPLSPCNSVPVASVRRYNPLSLQCANKNTCWMKKYIQNETHTYTKKKLKTD